MQNTAVICLSANSGGMELDSIRLVQTLAEPNVYLICKSQSFIEKSAQWQLGAKKTFTVDFRFNLSYQLYRHLRKILIKNNIKNIIFFGASELKSLHFAIRGLGINLIVRHGTSKDHSKKDFFHRLIYSQVNYHVAVSDYILDNVKKIIPFAPHTQAQRIYLSRHLKCPEIEVQGNEISMVHVGRIAQGKGHFEAIEAMHLLAQKGQHAQLKFLGAGDEELLYQLKKRVAQYGLEKQIHFLGHVEEVSDFIQQAQILLFPSWGEGLPNALVESFAFGAYPVVFENTVFPELKKLGFHLHLARDRDVLDLSEKLMEVIEQKSQLLEKLVHNQNLYQKYFTARVEKEQYQKILI